jgi:Tol biopolymer transport system component
MAAPGETTLVSKRHPDITSRLTSPESYSTVTDVSPNDRYLLINSTDGSLVPGKSNRSRFAAGFLDDPRSHEPASDAIIFDLQTGVRTVVPALNASMQGLHVSTDGQAVAYTSPVESRGNHQVKNEEYFRFDRTTGRALQLAYLDSSLASDDLQTLTGRNLIYRHSTGLYQRFEPLGPSASARILGLSADGRVVLFLDQSSGKSRYYLHDLQTNTSRLLPLAANGGDLDAAVVNPVLSGDGGFIFFQSDDRNLVTGGTSGTGLFAHNVRTGSTTLVPLAAPASPALFPPGLYPVSSSADGNSVLFTGRYRVVTNGQTTAFPFVLYLFNRTAGTSRELKICAVTSSRCKAILGASGRFLYVSTSAALDPGQDFNNADDVYRVDLTTNAATAVTRASNEFLLQSRSGSATSKAVGISADGRYVSFRSSADDIVLNDTNGREDTFLQDTLTGETRLIDLPADVQGQQLDAQGSHLLYSAGAGVAGSGKREIYLRNIVTNTTTLLTSKSGQAANAVSTDPHSSADLRYVVFTTTATNLTTDNSDDEDIVLLDRQTGTFERVSVPLRARTGSFSHSQRTPRVSNDGRFVVWMSEDRSGVNENQSRGPFLLRDRQLQTTRTACESSAGAGPGPQEPVLGWELAQQSRQVFFVAVSSLKAGVYICDLATNTLKPIPEVTEIPPLVYGSPLYGVERRYEVSVTPDGRYLSYAAYSGGESPDAYGDEYQVYLFDTVTRQKSKLPVSNNGSKLNQFTLKPLLDHNARFALLESRATNIAEQDRNYFFDVYRHEIDKARISFDLTLPSVPLSVKSGQSVQAPLTLSFGSEYKGEVSLACFDPPPNARCSFSPGARVADGKVHQIIATITTSTQSPSASVSISSPRDAQLAIFAAPPLLAAGGLWFLIMRVREIRSNRLARKATIVAIITMLGSCGGGGSDDPSPPSYATTTPPGLYVVGIRASDGTTTRNFSIQMEVSS